MNNKEQANHLDIIKEINLLKFETIGNKDFEV